MLDASGLSGGSLDANATGSVLPGLDASGLMSSGNALGLTNPLQSNPRPFSASSLPALDSPVSSFSTGAFAVGETGEVSFDYLVDGGKYQGELAIFSLQGIERYGIGSKLFVQEAALRASTNSDLGHIVISDRSEGARFDGSPSERNFNAGQYQGVKKFSMRAGEQFRWGGEVRVELSLTGIVTDIFGYIQIEGTAKLFQGTSEDTNDLADEEVINIQLKPGENTTQFKLENKGFGGGDYADIKLTFDNAETPIIS